MNSGLSELPKFWLEQWKEMNELAKHLIKAGNSRDEDVNMLILEFDAGVIKTKDELHEKVLAVIMEKTPAREKNEPKYKEQELF